MFAAFNFDSSYFTIFAAIIISCLCALAVADWLVKRQFSLTLPHKRIGCIDGLRGYLALFVLFHHFIIWLEISKSGAAWQAPSSLLFSSFGSGAVSLFFMTTGLVFYPKIISGFRQVSWVRVYISRIFRIIPLIIVSVAIITIIIMLRTGNQPNMQYLKAAGAWITSQGQPPLLEYPESGKINAYVLWSLKYEWLFYIFALPACAFLSDLMRGRLPSWVLPFAVLVISLTIKPFYHKPGLVLYLPFFAMGMIAYECQKRTAIQQFFQAKWMPFVAIACLLIGMLSAQSPYVIIPLVSYALFFISIACGNDLWGLLRTRGSLLLGECSFGIYLLHGIVLSVLFADFKLVHYFSNAEWAIIFMPVAVSITVSFSALSYVVIERPAIHSGYFMADFIKKRKFRIYYK